FVLWIFCSLPSNLLAQPPLPGVSEPVEVARVIDGDTIELVGGERIRYLGIDAPETHRKVNGQWIPVGEPFSREAAEFNRQRVEGEKVRLEFDEDTHDRFRRLLAYVFIGDDMVNVELIEEGLVRVRIHPPNSKYEKLFIRTQDQARAQGRGLWGLKP
ncbi:MAG TPA: thermonuclease family protein, partial [Nitrospiria bacterium]|nr:thermonuclease family protein [Nitrospiria bacterium]